VSHRTHECATATWFLGGTQRTLLGCSGGPRVAMWRKGTWSMKRLFSSSIAAILRTDQEEVAENLAIGTPADEMPNKRSASFAVTELGGCCP
jgi:hypothetical protein